jgi:PAS domain S-box-containing protein
MLATRVSPARPAAPASLAIRGANVSTLASNLPFATPGDGTDVDFRRVLELLPAAAYTCDPDGLITYFNQRAVATWGRAPRLRDPADRYCGSFRLFDADGTAIAHDDCWMARCLREGREYRDAEILIERPDGSRVTTKANAAPLYDEHGQLVGAVNVLVDISGMQRDQARRRESEAMLAGQKRALEMLAKGAALEDVLATLVRLLEESTPGLIGSFLVCDAGEERFCTAVAPGFSQRYADAFRSATFSPPYSGPCAMAAHRNEIVLCHDVATDDRWTAPWRELMVHLGLRSCRSVPIVAAGGRTLGSFGLYSRDTGCPMPEASLLAALTDLARIAIEHKRTEQALSASRAALEAELADTRLLQEASATLIGEHSDDEICDKLVDAAARIMRSDFASMQVLVPERGSGGELKLLAFRGFTPEAARFWEWVRLDSASTCGAAMRRGDRVIVGDVDDCAFMANTDDLSTYRQTGIRAVQTTPLLSRRGNAVGMVSTHWRDPHVPSERDLRLLDIVARQAADLIEHRNAQEGVRQREERLRAIFDCAAVGAAITLPDGRFIQVNNAFCAITGYEAAELQSLDCASLTHPDDRPEMQRLLDDLLAGRTARFVLEKRYFRKDATAIWVQNSVSLTRDAAGAPLHLVVLCQDITERRHAEDALAESHAQLREQADELARFNRAAVGRELRMIELKEEINLLCERLGEPPSHRLADDLNGRPARA